MTDERKELPPELEADVVRAEGNTNQKVTRDLAHEVVALREENDKLKRLVSMASEKLRKSEAVGVVLRRRVDDLESIMLKTTESYKKLQDAYVKATTRNRAAKRANKTKTPRRRLR